MTNIESPVIAEEQPVQYRIPPGSNPLFPLGLEEVPDTTTITEGISGVKNNMDLGTIIGVVASIIALIAIIYWITSTRNTK